ncbi:hypothetical protein BV22DRAFT_1036281 [Leucogyrophana mollusca]|uniref:Uncharacterized protein n=1 Tax=Leucogyrophana mollusca TaxID=85980 RepID=A0ACB8BDV4_9AGAM|nr:hypothetical protein BV22DRAFT_1036281 [Leucogyrophana mollusca]
MDARPRDVNFILLAVAVSGIYLLAGIHRSINVNIYYNSLNVSHSDDSVVQTVVGENEDCDAGEAGRQPST